jgi:hypothetical protein
MAGRVRATALAAATLTGCTLTAPLGGLSGHRPPDGGSGTSSVDAAYDGAVAEAGRTPGDDGGRGDVAVDDGFGSPADGADETSGCASAACVDLPLGFAVVAFGAASSGAACPPGFGQGTDTVEGPSVGAGACTCGCTLSTPPTCPANGAIANGYDTDGSGTCGTSGNTYANSGCGTEGVAAAFGPSDDHRFTPPGPTGGTCQAPTVDDQTKLTFASQGRVCQATDALPTCGAMVCPPPVGAPFVACLAATGDTTCPPQFPEKHLVGTNASFACTSGCTCSVTATCAGTIDYYASTNCSGPVAFQVPANGQCVGTNYGAYGSHQYVPAAPSGMACVAGGSTSASAPSLDATTTLCCSGA